MPIIELEIEAVDEVGVPEEKHIDRLIKLIEEARKLWKVTLINRAAVRR